MQKFRSLLYPALTFCFLLGMVGFFLGRRSVDGILLTTQHPEQTEAQSRSLPADPAGSGLPAGEKVELNRATLEELISLPGIGEARAKSIIEYRTANGPFRETTELMNVSGIGRGTFEKLREYVYVEDSNENTDH